MNLKPLFQTWKKVFGNWKRVTIVLIIAFLFYSINVLISNFIALKEFYSTLGFFGTLKFFLTLSLGFKNLIKPYSFITLILISFLFGILLSLIMYKSNLNINKNKSMGVFGGVGVFLGFFIPGCAACGIGLASLLGISAGALAFLPYDGLELSILAIFILGFSITKTTKEMYVCEVSKFSFHTNVRRLKK